MVTASVTAMNSEMMKQSEYILIVGLGMTGLSAARYFSRQGENIIVVDSRQNPPSLQKLEQTCPGIKIVLGEFENELFVNAKQIVISPGVSLKEPAIANAHAQGVDVLGDVELFARQVNQPVIAVTGSNGKSTVIKLLGEMAEMAGINAVVGGNIGVPVLDLLDVQADMYILELSSFQLETLSSLKPVSAAVLNVSPDHMDRYDSYDEYAAAKKRIYNNCKVAVINRDDSCVVNMISDQAFISGFTLLEPDNSDFGVCNINGERWLCKGNKKLIAESAVNIAGKHNIANVLAALALGEAANLPITDMLITLTRFKGLPHRAQFVTEINNIKWVNDSKGTNVGATVAAINGISTDNKLILIAGGVAKGQNFSALAEAATEKVRATVLIGEDASLIESEFKKHSLVTSNASDMHEAVELAYKLAESGDTVLLSPACASFDMFKGYEHRGEVFVKEVEALR